MQDARRLKSNLLKLPPCILHLVSWIANDSSFAGIICTIFHRFCAKLIMLEQYKRGEAHHYSSFKYCTSIVPFTETLNTTCGANHQKMLQPLEQISVLESRKIFDNALSQCYIHCSILNVGENY
jgi:hypothetical protein